MSNQSKQQKFEEDAARISSQLADYLTETEQKRNDIAIAQERLDDMREQQQRFRTNGSKLSLLLADDLSIDIQTLEENILEALLEVNHKGESSHEG